MMILAHPGHLDGNLPHDSTAIAFAVLTVLSVIRPTIRLALTAWRAGSKRALVAAWASWRTFWG